MKKKKIKVITDKMDFTCDSVIAIESFEKGFYRITEQHEEVVRIHFFPIKRTIIIELTEQ